MPRFHRSYDHYQPHIESEAHSLESFQAVWNYIKTLLHDYLYFLILLALNNFNV